MITDCRIGDEATLLPISGPWQARLAHLAEVVASEHVISRFKLRHSRTGEKKTELTRDSREHRNQRWHKSTAVLDGIAAW